MKSTIYFMFILMFLLAGCSGNQVPNTDIAVAVALTQTAAMPATETLATPTPIPQSTSSTDINQGSEQNDTNILPIEFQANSNFWYTQYDVAPDAVSHFVLSGLAGQQVTVWLSNEGDPLSAVLNISSADGQFHTTTPEIYWSMVLPTSQDYYIDVNSLSSNTVMYQLTVKISPSIIDPALGAMYEPISDSLCQDLGATASDALGVNFTVQIRAPFFDGIAGEAGQGCTLLAGGNGTQFTNPQDIVNALKTSIGLGWTEQPLYAADGPTGSSIGLARDMGLMLVSANRKPAMGIQCPSDQPITECNLSPDQMTYSIEVDVAQYKTTFSLDGHWEDAGTGFTLDLYQNWKTIYGSHSVVADGGNKIDSMDDSINGTLDGQVAIVQFQSSFAAEPGAAQLTYVDANTMQWKIINPPNGEYYLPAEATLKR